ncbi:CBS domain-containing protein [Halorientalis brevis]|uniref:CBS domain-containing protein n=1 Tax=Halorientalis brevis TaxID=1126241 RepID=A0ABD6C920_9EURY|nr:CBS domain-containing protein [Halorientalis brevis]
MDITDIVSTDYVEFQADQRVSKLVGAFEDPDVKGVVVADDGEFEGVVTRRQLAASHHNPEEKVRSLVWSVPRLAPGEDIREAARLMIDSNAKVLPVFEGDNLRGVVTADSIIGKVQPNLSEATVGQASSDDLVTVGPEATFGEAIHDMREQRITHLPVVESESRSDSERSSGERSDPRDSEVVGILSLYDVIGLAARAMTKSQGGNANGPEQGMGTTHGGFGAREGESQRMLDLPVRDVMVSPVRTITSDETLQAAVEEMDNVNGSALVVTDGDDTPTGILTKTDVLESLTWGAEGSRAVEIYGADYLDDMTFEDVKDVIDGLEGRDSDLSVLDAKVALHQHDEKLRGTPLLQARIRLYTDDGLFMATGEGYGAKAAISEAREALDRRIRDNKTYGQSKKHPDEAFWQKRFGWMLEE